MQGQPCCSTSCRQPGELMLQSAANLAHCHLYTLALCSFSLPFLQRCCRLFKKVLSKDTVFEPAANVLKLSRLERHCCMQLELCLAAIVQSFDRCFMDFSTWRGAALGQIHTTYNTTIHIVSISKCHWSSSQWLTWSSASRSACWNGVEEQHPPGHEANICLTCCRHALICLTRSSELQSACKICIMFTNNDSAVLMKHRPVIGALHT